MGQEVGQCVRDRGRKTVGGCPLATPEVMLFHPSQSLSSLGLVWIQSMTGFPKEYKKQRAGSSTIHFRRHS